MSPRRRAVRVTANFERNLDEISQFLSGDVESVAFDSLLTLLFESTIPTIDRFPEIGRDLLERAPQSVEGLAQIDLVRRKLAEDATVREYVVEDYLVLYSVSDAGIHLLAIRHHKQLSFDFRGHWAR